MGDFCAHCHNLILYLQGFVNLKGNEALESKIQISPLPLTVNTDQAWATPDVATIKRMSEMHSPHLPLWSIRALQASMTVALWVSEEVVSVGQATLHQTAA